MPTVGVDELVRVQTEQNQINIIKKKFLTCSVKLLETLEFQEFLYLRTNVFNSQ